MKTNVHDFLVNITLEINKLSNQWIDKKPNLWLQYLTGTIICNDIHVWHVHKFYTSSRSQLSPSTVMPKGKNNTLNELYLTLNGVWVLSCYP